MGGPITVHTQEGLRDRSGSVGGQAGGGVDVLEEVMLGVKQHQSGSSARAVPSLQVKYPIPWGRVSENIRYSQIGWFPNSRESED